MKFWGLVAVFHRAALGLAYGKSEGAGPEPGDRGQRGTGPGRAQNWWGFSLHRAGDGGESLSTTPAPGSRAVQAFSPLAPRALGAPRVLTWHHPQPCIPLLSPCSRGFSLRGAWGRDECLHGQPETAEAAGHLSTSGDNQGPGRGCGGAESSAVGLPGPAPDLAGDSPHSSVTQVPQEQPAETGPTHGGRRPGTVRCGHACRGPHGAEGLRNAVPLPRAAPPGARCHLTAVQDPAIFWDAEAGGANLGGRGLGGSRSLSPASPRRGPLDHTHSPRLRSPGGPSQDPDRENELVTWGVRGPRALRTGSEEVWWGQRQQESSTDGRARRPGRQLGA